MRPAHELRLIKSTQHIAFETAGSGSHLVSTAVAIATVAGAPVDEIDQMPVVVIGASAGGVNALSRLVGALPAALDAAVFIVLHIPAHGRSELAAILQRSSRLPVATAEDGEPVAPGRIRVAPADRHLVLEAGHVRLTRGPRECRARPAVDVLFRSAAAAYGARVIGVILSGTLDDGTAGLWSVKDQGGVALVQDPTTAEHRGMPESACRFIEVDAILEPALLGAEIARLVGRMEAVAPGRVDEQIRIETRIALQRGIERGDVARLGRASSYSCPECHRPLVRIEEGRIDRFRCHNGHAFSPSTLLIDANAAIDRGIWDAIRTVEEREPLLREMADAADEVKDSDAARQYRQQADGTPQRVQALRELVLDHRFLGPAIGDERSSPPLIGIEPSAPRPA